jgi:hypothetical protein
MNESGRRRDEAILSVFRKPGSLFFREGPMDCRKKPGGRSRRGWFRGIARGLGICLAGALAVSWGCSRSEDTPPQEKNKVVVAIRKPMPKPAPEKKVEVPPATPQEPAASGVAAEKKASPEQGPAKRQEPSAPEAAAAPKPGPAVTQTEARPPEKPEVSKPEKGVVRVREGESLMAVAARKDVYGDPLKWPRLYRLNPGRLAMIRTWEDVKERRLPEGLSLRYVLPTKEREGRSPLQAKPWVITIRSWQTPGKLAGPAIKLLQNGYHVYITRAVVKDKPWLRLRVGFYGGKAEALDARKKIQEILGTDDSWVSRAGEKEREEFGGD